MRGFADHVAPGGDGYLMLVGPAVKDVIDDPEGAAVYGECLLQWRDLSLAARARILLVTLPLDDIDEQPPRAARHDSSVAGDASAIKPKLRAPSASGGGCPAIMT